MFFPGTTLPLHVFEPRYRAMVRDAQDRDGLFAVALETDDGFRRIGTAGRIRELQPLRDGAFKLQLKGLARVSLREISSGTPYPLARVEPRLERMGTTDLAEINEARLELLASYGMLRSMIRGNEPLVRHQDLPFEIVVNTVCAGTPIEVPLRQRLLEEDTLIGRQRLAMDYLTTLIDATSWLQAMRRGATPFLC